MPALVGTTLVNRELRDDGAQTLARACASDAAAGFIETSYAYSILPALNSHGAFTIALRGCGGTVFASATGGSAHRSTCTQRNHAASLAAKALDPHGARRCWTQHSVSFDNQSETWYAEHPL